MATATRKTRCSICGKETRTFMCEGCSQNFCRIDLTKHLQELNEQLDHIENNHDQLRQKLIQQKENPKNRSLLQQIDQWEEEAMNKIKQTANQCRQKLNNYTDQFLTEIENQLNDLAKQIKDTREENQFNEIDLNQLNKRFTKLEEELDKPSNVLMEQQSTSFINRISLRIPIDNGTSVQPTINLPKTSPIVSTLSSLNQPSINLQQSLGSFKITPSAQKQEIANEKSQSSFPLTATNNNSASSTQPGQFSFKSGSTSPLVSLANTTEPNPFSWNQQQTPVATFPQRTVATFPQRTTRGSPITTTGSSSGVSFSQTSNQPFQFTTSSSSAAPAFSFVNHLPANFSFDNPPPANVSFNNPPPANVSFNNPPPANVSTFPSANQTPANDPRFSLPNFQPGNPPNFSFNQPTTNSQVRQPLGSLIITPSVQKQEMANDRSQSSFTLTSTNNPNQISTTNEMPRYAVSNAVAYSKKLSDPPTLVSEQSSLLDQDEEESDTPASLAENSLLSKQINTTLRDSSASAVDRTDPNSPLYSLKSFEELILKPDLLKGVYNMGFRSPSKIQAIALLHLLSDPPKNIIAQSQSGTGKTAAFTLAILSRINPSIQSPQALVLAPTDELALQIGSVIEKMAQFLPSIQVAYAVCGEAKSNINNLARGQLLPQSIVVGTLSTVEDWCRKKEIIDLKKLQMLVIDEADMMIATESFQVTCVNLVRDLNHANCQMMLFSATYSDEVIAYAREIIQQPVVLRLKREKQALQNMKQFFIECSDPEQKYDAIREIFRCLTVGQAIIFCRTKATAHDLAVRMANEHHSVRELTSALYIEQRAAIITQFRHGVFRILISTNVTSRGIDIEDISLVINYDMPVTTSFQPDFETYLHRIGRCGRFGKIGYTFNLIGSEKDFNTMKQIEEYFSHPIDQITIEGISQLAQDEE